jgi:hypothetical protein
MVRWEAVQYALIEPVVVDWPAIRSAFYSVERVFVPLIGIEQFVFLRHALKAVMCHKTNSSTLYIYGNHVHDSI